MARVSKQQMERNREEIIQVSSQLFRERGLNGVSLNDLMAAAGLTHGGFYGHFRSKDELVAIASERALEESGSRWLQIFQQPENNNLSTLVDFYLSAMHRDNAGDGCLITALASDVAREDAAKKIHDVYLEGVKSMLARLESVSDIDNNVQRRNSALVQLAMLTGALTLSRATAGDSLSDELLEVIKKEILKKE
ncbi:MULTISPECIES: TetR/AcrR family transcriptional regulator [unclassified Raoultella]|uniref:TetR/AcrR family transcriptional regulator n=1 Tax=unclassified Raoultella TaxID=2627600 RepID=UPI0013581826|nr:MULTISPECIES: TetR/AcrR family transcriptional regulator [unclassified Raoultella]